MIVALVPDRVALRRHHQRARIHFERPFGNAQFVGDEFARRLDFLPHVSPRPCPIDDDTI